jgi:protease I
MKRITASIILSLGLSTIHTESGAQMTINDHGLLQTSQLYAKSTVPTINTAALLAAKGIENDKLRAIVFEKNADTDLLKGKNIAILTTDGVEELELTVTTEYLKRRGAKVHIVAPQANEIEKLGLTLPAQRNTHILTVRYMENGGWVKFDKKLSDADITSYDALIIPGGAWNPDNLRMDSAVLKAVQEAMAKNILVASICHGPQVLISAESTKGRRMTGYWAIQTDLKNSGAQVSDQSVVVDGNLITSRYPLDLPDFLNAISQQLKK